MNEPKIENFSNADCTICIKGTLKETSPRIISTSKVMLSALQIGDFIKITITRLKSGTMNSVSETLNELCNMFEKEGHNYTIKRHGNFANFSTLEIQA